MKQISDALFMELCKFFLLGENTADVPFIKRELEAKVQSAVRRQEYTASVIDHKKTEP